MNSYLKKNDAVLTKARDLPCLRFLWRWKVATTEALCRKFYAEAALHTGYKRLLRLEDSGFIQSRVDPTGSIHVWMLTQKGFQTVRTFLPPLKEEGFKSENLIHGWLVSAIHLGDLLIEKREGIGQISEQELRRVEPDFFPGWVPKSTLHRPDGYTRVDLSKEGQGTPKTIALEVELSLKSTAQYQQVAEFYSKKEIHQVIWITPKESMGHRIERILALGTHGEHFSHSFVDLHDVIQSGTEASIRSGLESGSTLGKCLYPRLGSPSQLSPTRWMLNARKSPYNSDSSIENRLAGIF
ncbi:hypothetical protein K2X30_03115 [bacterium]|nr:hypothetical protein [bacterium]